MNIAIFMLPERGGFYPTFSLARELVRRGHAVCYYGAVDFEQDVRRQGLEYVTLFQAEYDTGTLDPDPLPDSLFAWLRMLKRQFARPGKTRLFAALVNGEIVALLRKHQTDLVLLDPLFAILTETLVVAGFRVINLATELISIGTGTPPSSSSLVYEGGLFDRLMCWALWFGVYVVHCLKRMRGISLQLFLSRQENLLVRELKKTRKHSGVKYAFSEYGWRPVLPELVLCPRKFDFPEAVRDRFYLGLSVDLHRSDVDFPWDRVRDTPKDIVYASLGTHAALYRNKTSRFLASLIETARQRSDLLFIVVLGKGRAPQQFGALPSNVVAVEFAPQLEVLKKATVMITNGGLGTIKECMLFGVPMIVLPCDFDQPGNAARVVFHGLGVRSKIEHASSARLSAMIDECRGNEKMKAALKAMSADLLNREDLEACISWLEQAV